MSIKEITKPATLKYKEYYCDRCGKKIDTYTLLAICTFCDCDLCEDCKTSISFKSLPEIPRGETTTICCNECKDRLTKMLPYLTETNKELTDIINKIEDLQAEHDTIMTECAHKMHNKS